MTHNDLEGGRDGQTDGRKDGRTDGWTDGRTDGWMDGRTDGWTDGQIPPVFYRTSSPVGAAAQKGA